MDSKEPLVSVIIPAYNAAAYIREALDSVFAQTYKNKEVIVVDDGSTDDTWVVLEPFIAAKKIAYYKKTNGGPSAARNFGMERARGAFIAFLDADDIYLPEKLEKQIGDLQTHPDAGVSYCDIWHFNDGEPDKLFMNTRSYYAGPDVLGKLFEMNFMNPLMIVLRKSAVERVGMFDESYPRSEDWEYWLRLAYAGVKFLHCGGKPLAEYRVRKSGLSYGWKIKVEEKKTMLRIFTELYDRMTPDERKRYPVAAAISRQRRKLWAAYIGNALPPVQWVYQWLRSTHRG